MGAKPTTEYHEATSTQRRRDAEESAEKQKQVGRSEQDSFYPGIIRGRGDSPPPWLFPVFSALISASLRLCVELSSTTPPAARNRTAPVRASRGWRGARSCALRLPGRATSGRAPD